MPLRVGCAAITVLAFVAAVAATPLSFSVAITLMFEPLIACMKPCVRWMTLVAVSDPTRIATSPPFGSAFFIA